MKRPYKKATTAEKIHIHSIMAQHVAESNGDTMRYDSGWDDLKVLATVLETLPESTHLKASHVAGVRLEMFGKLEPPTRQAVTPEQVVEIVTATLESYDTRVRNLTDRVHKLEQEIYRLNNRLATQDTALKVQDAAIKKLISAQ